MTSDDIVPGDELVVVSVVREPLNRIVA